MMGDDGFEPWYRETHVRLVNALVLVSGDLDVAREVADEAFARCLERWDGHRRPNDPTAWTYRVAVNLLRRRWRRRRRDHDLAIATVGPGSVDLPEPAIELWRAVTSLSQRARLAVVLRYVGGLTEPEVAAAMGIAPGTVSATLSKARARLRIELADLAPPRCASDPDGPSQTHGAMRPTRATGPSPATDSTQPAAATEGDVPDGRE